MTPKSLLFRVLRMLLITAMVAGALSAAIPMVTEFLPLLGQRPERPAPAPPPAPAAPR